MGNELVVDEMYDGGIAVIYPTAFDVRRGVKIKVRRIEHLRVEKLGIQMDCVHPPAHNFFKIAPQRPSQESAFSEFQGRDPNAGEPGEHNFSRVILTEDCLKIAEERFGEGYQYYELYPAEVDLAGILAKLTAGSFVNFA